MGLVSIYRLIKFSFQNFFRNFWLSLVTITIIILSLFSINSLLGLSGVSQAILASVTDKIDVSVYFLPAASEEAVLIWREQANALPETKNTELITAQQALDKFRLEHSDDALVNEALNELETNPLGAVLLIQAESLDSYDSLLTKLENLDNSSLVEDIEFEDRRLLISRLDNLSKKINMSLLVLSGFFLLISVLVVFNTIRLGIYAHREEIAIMKLVGASNWFTRMPFIFEGFLYAIVSMIIFWALYFLILSWLDPILIVFFDEINFSANKYFLDNFFTFFWQQLVGLTLINSISATVAIRRHLRV